jgi:hypothetical protein
LHPLFHPVSSCTLDATPDTIPLLQLHTANFL